jgi:hypothetical protein
MMRFILASQGIYGNIPFFIKAEIILAPVGGDNAAGLIVWQQKDDCLLFHGISDILI